MAKTSCVENKHDVGQQSYGGRKGSWRGEVARMKMAVSYSKSQSPIDGRSMVIHHFIYRERRHAMYDLSLHVGLGRVRPQQVSSYSHRVNFMPASTRNDAFPSQADPQRRHLSCRTCDDRSSRAPPRRRMLGGLNNSVSRISFRASAEACSPCPVWYLMYSRVALMAGTT